MKGTSVSRSFSMVKCSSAKSPSTSSYEYQSREKSLAPTGMRHAVKQAPTPGREQLAHDAVAIGGCEGGQRRPAQLVEARAEAVDGLPWRPCLHDDAGHATAPLGDEPLTPLPRRG